MTGDQTASLLYLALLGTVLAGWYFVSNRRQIGKMAQTASIWVFIFLGAVVTAGLWGDIRDDIVPRQSSMMDGARIEVPMAQDGHFYLVLEVNGTPVRFAVDTGASEIVLSAQDADRVGIPRDTLVFTGRAATANGMVETAPVRLASVSLEGVVDEGVLAVVNGGEMTDSLLGMTYLRRFQRLEISGNKLILER